jgi:sulfite exporter TauE/SafE
VTGVLSEPGTIGGLWAVFLVGLAGGFGHCITMCGPIAAAGGAWSGTASSAEGGRRGRAVALWQIGYQAGRVLTYTAIGAALGGLGSLGAVRGAIGPLQRLVWLVAGEIMIIMGLAIAGVPLLSRFGRRLESGWAKASGDRFRRAYRALIRSGPRAAFPFGMLMGLMPCGFLISIELYAVGSGSALAGAATMLAFGLGTVPALAASGALGGLLGAKSRAWLTYSGAAVVIVLGVFYVVRAVGALGSMPVR